MFGIKKKKIVQPEWCDYPNDELGNAATPVLGCWSLLEGNINKPEDCSECTGEMCRCFNENWKKRKKEKKKRKIFSCLKLKEMDDRLEEFIYKTLLAVFRVGIFLIKALFVKLVWNIIMPSIFAVLPVISYGEALALLFLSNLLFNNAELTTHIVNIYRNIEKIHNILKHDL